MRSIGRFAAEVLLPLRLAAQDQRMLQSLLADAGWAGLDDTVTLADLGPLMSIAGLVDGVDSILEALAEEDAEAGDVVGHAVLLLADVLDLVADFADFVPGGAVPQELLDQVSVVDVAESIPAVLVARWLELRSPPVLAVLFLLGVLRDLPVERPGGGAARRLVADWGLLGAALSDPLQAVADRYGWAAGHEWRHAEFLEHLRRVGSAFGLPTRVERIESTFVGDGRWFERPPEGGRQVALPLRRGFVGDGSAAVFGEVGFVVLATPSAVGGPIDGLVVANLARGEVNPSWSTPSGWAVSVAGDLTATGLVQLRFAAGLAPAPATGATGVALSVVVSSPEFDSPVIGEQTGSRLLVGGVTASLAIALGAGPEVAVDLRLEGRSGGRRGLDLVVSGGDGDGLIASILGDQAIATGLDLGLGWSTSSGFAFHDDSALEIDLPTSIAIGPIEITRMVIAVELDAGVVALSASLDIGGSLGPFAVSVAGIGFGASLATSHHGSVLRLGELGVGIGFVPPTGLAFGIDLGVVAGGGGVFIDNDAGTYEGVLQLRVMSIGVSAFVLIETKRPDVDGWSFMMALYIEIPAIQLGFGFVLTGLGGFAGINRGVDAEALGDAVRSGSMNTILFPDDPIADAPIILDTLAAMFPAADGQYVFGPVVRLGWGTPQLVEVAVGVVIELPDPIRIAMIGTVDALLPRPEAPLVELHLAVAGVIDFEAGTLAIDASLHHSKIVGFDLAGDMALRAGFKGRPSFLFSLGGFHPDFEPPAGFPALQRLSIGLSAGSMFRLTFECYIAITSNTVQFGAAFELVAEVSGFGVEGGAEFDALIQFNPFRLKTSIRFHISVKALNVDLMGVLIRGDLEGPNPWHITGSAEFKILGVKDQINVDEIIGGSTPDVVPDPPDVLALVAEALALDDAWAAGTSTADGVTLAAPAETSGDELLVVPHGSVEIAQTVVPLDQVIEKFGNAEHLVHDRFRFRPGPGLTESGTVEQYFAPAFFASLKPKERLAAPSFESMKAGLAFGGGTTAGASRGTPLGYEPILADPDYELWLAEHRRPAPTVAEPNRPRIDVGPLVRALGDELDIVVGVGSFGMAAPTFVVADADTGMAVTAVQSGGSFLAAATAVGSGQVIRVAGESSWEAN